MGRWSSLTQEVSVLAHLQHLTTWKNGNFLEVWMEKEVMGKEKVVDGGAGRLVTLSL